MGNHYWNATPHMPSYSERVQPVFYVAYCLAQLFRFIIGGMVDKMYNFTLIYGF